MSRSAAEILDSWQRDLLPPGAAWPRAGGSNLGSLLAAFAFARSVLEGDIAALEREISPGTSTLLLADYQAVLGPDPAGRDAEPLSQAQLQTLLQQRWVGAAGQTISYYESLGAAFGISLTITEPEVAKCNKARCGRSVCSQSTRRFVWVVNLSAENPGLRRLIQLNAPADTTVVILVRGEFPDGLDSFILDQDTLS